MLIFHLLCYAAVLKILTYYAQYYAHVCLKFDCSIRVYSQNYRSDDCSIRVYQVLYMQIIIVVSVLLEYIDLY